MSIEDAINHQNASTNMFKQHTSNQHQTGNMYMRLDVNGTRPNVGSNS